MIKTLLLCFIHGFKGDEETFFQFPIDLENLVQEKSPGLDVQTAIYPKYETRGDLAVCVECFREWLQSQVTSLEQSAATPTAILNPSVAVVLVSHSMGGVVATDSLFSILTHSPTISGKKCMFPLVAGSLTFDTPFNGLTRSLFAYGAFSQYQNVSAAWNILSTLSGGIGLSAASAVRSGAGAGTRTVSASVPGWKRWQLLAARTGTVGAVVAGGVTAYMHREEIGNSLSNIPFPNINTGYFKKENMPDMPKLLPSLPGREILTQNLNLANVGLSRESIGEGFAWMASHLKFVGALMKQEQLSTRLERLDRLSGVGRCNVFTSLGDNGYWSGGYFVPRRTFCAIPTRVVGGQSENIEKAEINENGWWKEATNAKAENEIAAHCGMFRPDRNDGYQSLLEFAADMCVSWVMRCEVREVVDGFAPDEARAARSRSESETLDDDGNVKAADELLRKRNSVGITGNTTGDEDEEAQVDEDERQLKAILACQTLPEPEDGGVSEEVLKEALRVPLPTDDDFLKEACRVPLPSEERVS